jgi:DNA-binding transcriptional regulator YdaS (Cro superfamily)
MSFNNVRLAALLLMGVILSTVTEASALQAQRLPPGGAEMQRRASETLEALRQDLDPDLLKRAAEKGLYRRDDYPVLRSMNPFFIRGDFNGDGGTDLAFWVTQRSSGLRGVAIIHSTLDAVHYLGAGHDEYRHYEKPGEVFADAWHVLPVGSVQQPVNMSVPEIGAVEGQPFTFRRETLQFNWLGRSSYVYYWVNGRYWMIQTGD